ncbi:MAG: DNA repair protein RecO [Lachnospiraceae bacterium]|nr:DNA repair protein RecO [Lachnospiraceae bacterium]MBO7634170.1 DNA repair protein RecO [Lachnospiraceae bacterium]MBP5652876.1 DNA repair protein RecO [Lachnospiraceae bacterium]
MAGEVTVHGIVLTSMPVNDFDRRITILTSERGRITAFAKGARRPTGAFLACTRGFTYGEFTLFEGRDAYSVKSVDKTRYFKELEEDLEGMYYGMYFCELAGAFTREELEEAGQMKLLYLALLALAKKTMPARLIRCVYELRAITIYGEGMRTDGEYYTARYNGLNAENYAGSVKVSETALYTVRFIEQTPLKELFSFKVSDEVMDELERITRDYMENKTERRFKTLEVLETIL